MGLPQRKKQHSRHSHTHLHACNQQQQQQQHRAVVVGAGGDVSSGVFFIKATGHGLHNRLPHTGSSYHYYSIYNIYILSVIKNRTCLTQTGPS